MSRVEPEWLLPDSDVTLWVDLSAPTAEETQLLVDLFQFHPLSVEDARSAIQFPKIETYGSYLYLILHGIDATAGDEAFATRDVDFFLGPSYLVTVHDGQSRSIGRLRSVCDLHGHILAEGPVALLHRIVDAMVDNYQPEMEKLEERIGDLEEQAHLGDTALVGDVLRLRRDLGSMRRILSPQRDAIGRLSRREFQAISTEMAYRFRDVYDHVVRFSDEALLFQERVNGVLDVNFNAVSNRLNQVMKVLTVMSTIFLPLTVLSGMWGMNVPLPHFPGGEGAQFWWVAGIMVTICVAMLVVFRRRNWI